MVPLQHCISFHFGYGASQSLWEEHNAGVIRFFSTPQFCSWQWKSGRSEPLRREGLRGEAAQHGKLRRQSQCNPNFYINSRICALEDRKQLSESFIYQTAAGGGDATPRR